MLRDLSGAQWEEETFTIVLEVSTKEDASWYLITYRLFIFI
jgi:hypothetical protein